MTWLSKRLVQGLHLFPTAHCTKHLGQMGAEQSEQVNFVLEWSQAFGTGAFSGKFSERI